MQEHKYVDFSSPKIREKVAELFSGLRDDTQKAKIAYEFVRDEISHTFDIQSDVIIAKASDVLQHKTGICHAKANLLAALLRPQGIPTGFCFQRMRMNTGSYAVHCYNAIYLSGRWIKVDARGNKQGINAQFSSDEPILAYPCRLEYDEYFWSGIYAAPHDATMKMLERAKSLQDILDTIPDLITESPDMPDIPNIVEEYPQCQPFPITIRLAIPADAPDIAEVLMRSWEVAYKDIVPADFIRERNATRTAQFKIPDDDTSYYIMQKYGKTVGMMRLLPDNSDDSIYDLQAIYLHPDYFLQGIGTTAMEFAFEKARSLGKTAVTVWVLEDNINAIKFYKKCGFAVDDGKTRIWNYGKPLAGIKMRKDL